MDPGSLNKLGNKIDETGTSRKIADDPQKSKGAAAEAGPRNDTVELTSGAKLLERLEKSLASLPDVDSARVDAIKAAIENGDYEIDAEAIAAAMIRLERSLGE
ncbi:MAG: flagellar biosynthesis anti-sigma factor FlgM [Woeseiaceae bacterium]|nr:flagellar biosynthesis anti-sigma factor FlgM [Woeseiaceae bacterium]